jgi:hypothetical protein
MYEWLNVVTDTDKRWYTTGMMACSPQQQGWKCAGGCRSQRVQPGKPGYTSTGPIFSF